MLLLLTVLVLAAGFAALGRLAGPKTMLYYLHTTSAGRLFAYIAEGNGGSIEGHLVERSQVQSKTGSEGSFRPYHHARNSPPIPVDTEQWLVDVGWRKVDLVGIDTNLPGVIDDADSGRQYRPAYAPVSLT